MNRSSVLRITAAALMVIAGIAVIFPLVLAGAPQRSLHVAGHGVDRADGALVHSEQKTSNGLIRSSTEIVELEGDLHGRVLYQVTTRIDSASGTLRSTGRQVYSGTVAGSEPVMLYDDRFVFEANLATGADHGQVYLVRHLAGPAVRCVLEVTGTGKDGRDNPLFTYSGDCVFASSDAAAR